MKYENIGLTHFHMYFSCLETNAKELYNLSTTEQLQLTALSSSRQTHFGTSFFYYLERFSE